jgi:hypothetical protein
MTFKVGISGRTSNPNKKPSIGDVFDYFSSIPISQDYKTAFFKFVICHTSSPIFFWCQNNQHSYPK